VSDPDAVVIGAGPNGLVGANLLADRGWQVEVLEATPAPGGGARSAELMEPGFVNDVCSAFYPLGAGSPVLRALGLEEHGLTWRHSPLVLAHPALDGSCPVLSRDLDETVESWERHHRGDGVAWRSLYARWCEVADPLLDALLTPFPPVGASVRLARRIPPREWADFVRFLLLPVRQLTEERFGCDASRRLLAGAALHADLGPEANLSGFFGWLLCSLGQQFGFPVPEGGASAITEALVRRLEARGGRVRTSSPVDAVVVRGGRAEAVRVGGEELRATRAVLADVSAPLLYDELLDEDALDARTRERLGRFQWDNGTVKVDWNLDAPIPWTAAPARGAGTVHLAEGLDALSRAATDLACGDVPPEPFLIVGQQSMTDPTRQPPGKETAWAYTHVPHPRALARDGRRLPPLDPLVEQIERTIELHAPGFRRTIRARHVLAPSDFEREDPSLVGGALNAGTAQLHQQLVFRPMAGGGRAETPVDRLYLASASAHPGGGVHGAPGANAARAALLHDRLRSVRARRGRPSTRRT
jgi:phytoene dehydrogenase-like protein